jgi:hypothetical protein
MADAHTHTMMTDDSGSGGRLGGGLLDGLEDGARGIGGRVGAGGAGGGRGGLRGGLNAWAKRRGEAWRARMSDPQRGPRTRRALVAAFVVAVVGAGVGVYFAVRPVPQPDYMNDSMSEVFNYTLLTDEFNKLPVEKRLELIASLIKRLQGMSRQDSVLLAAFGAGIAGQAREQVKENVSRLGVDMLDKYAKDYRNVPEGERERYLEQSFLDMAKTMEALGGRPRDISDEERLAEVRRQAQRDRERLREAGATGRGPDGEDLGGFFNFMNNEVGSRATPQQRVRGQQMLRDMGRMFRNQDPETGKPLPAGGGGAGGAAGEGAGGGGDGGGGDGP